MKHLPINNFGGLNTDYNPRVIPDNKFASGNNLLFEKKRVKNRWGYLSFGSNLPLNGAVTNIMFFERLTKEAKFLIVTTIRDTYKYVTESGKFEFITKNYIVGQVSCAGGTTVTGNGTTFDTAWVEGICQIKFGTTDMNGTGTPDTWYDIATWTDATHFELSGNGANTGGDVDYVIRLCWSGAISDEHSYAMPFLLAEADKLLVLTNGVDDIQKWNGTGACENLGGSPNKAKFIGYFGSTGYEHTVLASTIDSGDNFPQTIETSDAGTPEVWSGNYYHLYNKNDPIEGIKTLQTRLMIYHKNSISEAWAQPAGGNVDPFGINQNKINSVGTPSIRTVVDFGNFHIFYGLDNVYIFDGISVMAVGEEIINTLTSEVTKKYADKAFAFAIKDFNLYCLFLPVNDNEYNNKAYVYNYIEKSWAAWETPNDMTCFGTFRKEYSPIWTELIASGETYAEMTQRWRDLIVYDNNISYLYGDREGYIYEFNSDYSDDNGTEIDVNFVTKDYPLNDVKHTFSLLEVVWGLINKDTGSARIRASVDFGENWSDWVIISLDSNNEYFEHIINYMQKGLQVRFEVQNISGAEFELESFDIGFNDAGIRR